MSAEPMVDAGASVLRRPDVVPVLSEARSYWLATVHPSGRPHVRPALGVWADGVLHTTHEPVDSQKAQPGP